MACNSKCFWTEVSKGSICPYPCNVQQNESPQRSTHHCTNFNCSPFINENYQSFCFIQRVLQDLTASEMNWRTKIQLPSVCQGHVSSIRLSVQMEKPVNKGFWILTLKAVHSTTASLQSHSKYTAFCIILHLTQTDVLRFQCGFFKGLNSANSRIRMESDSQCHTRSKNNIEWKYYCIKMRSHRKCWEILQILSYMREFAMLLELKTLFEVLSWLGSDPWRDDSCQSNWYRSLVLAHKHENPNAYEVHMSTSCFRG